MGLSTRCPNLNRAGMLDEPELDDDCQPFTVDSSAASASCCSASAPDEASATITSWAAVKPRSAENLEIDCGTGSRVAGLKRGGTTEFLRSKKQKVTWASPPASLVDLQSWPEVCLQRVGEQELMENLLEKVRAGVILDSDYTGSGCMEQAATLIRDSLAIIQQECVDKQWLRAHRACDIDARCRGVLQEQAHEGLKPDHIFGDLCERLDEKTKLEFTDICERWAQHRADLCDCFDDIQAEHHAVSRIVGKAMTREMIAVMERGGAEHIGKESSGWCFIHNRRCRLFAEHVCNSVALL